MKTVLCVGGTDPTGGAGLTLDARVCVALGCYPLTVATCVVVQDIDRVRRVVPLNVAHILAQLAAAVDTLWPDAVKISVLPTDEAIDAISEFIEQRKLVNIVADPVFWARNGTPLTPSPPDSTAWREKLAPKCQVVTLNAKEAEALTKKKIRTAKRVEAAARQLARELNTAVVVKGGHLPREAPIDVVAEKGKVKKFTGKRLKVRAHGIGCAFSTAVACGLAQGLSVSEAVEMAKKFVEEILPRAREVGDSKYALLIP